MYCSTCELEIKGDDKAACPVCGGPLSDSYKDDSIVLEQAQQEPSGVEALFKDTESSVEPEPSSDEPGPDEVFVLKDYATDALNEDSAGASPGATDESSLFKEAGVQNSAEPEQGSAVNMDDILDSIRESIATPVNPDAGPAAGGSELDSFDVDFGSFDSFGQDASSDAATRNNADESADISWGYDEAASAVPMPDIPQRKRSPVLSIILIVVLIAVGGYYVFMTRSGDQAPLVNAPAELTADVEPEEPVMPEEDESVATFKPDSAGEKSTSKLPAQAGGQVFSSSDAAEAVASTEVVVAGEGEAVKASIEAAPEAAVAPGQAEAVVAGEAEAVKPSAEAEPEVVVAPEKAEAVAPVKPEPVKTPFFTVHVGSYQKRVSASSEVDRIQAKGYDAFVERVDLGKKGVWYRVKVGRFKNRAEAEKLQKRIENVLVTDSMVVTQRTN